MSKRLSEIKTVFFGTSEMSVFALEELWSLGLVPAVIITAPDSRAGRGRKLTPPPVKLWALDHDIDVLQPSALDTDFIAELGNSEWDAFMVYAYGKILPQALLDIPIRGTLNIHPSMLPLLRGPSPVRTALLNDDMASMGVSIIELDDKMDHGPIVAQASVELSEWPMPGRVLDEMLSREGGKLLAEVLPLWLSGELVAEPQEHDLATYCHFLKKSDGELDLNNDGYNNYIKYCAYDGWPGTFFFDSAGKRIKITEAHLGEQGEFVIDKIIPEGKKEISWSA
jgi:methionyl-tRNA formyltransferase